MRSVDVIAEALEALKLRGTVYFQADFRAPWGMAIPAGDVAAFHVVTGGACWLRASAISQPRQLSRGDIVLIPHGHAHELAHDREAEARPARELLAEPANDAATPSYGGTGTSTNLVCGHFEYDQKALHPFFLTLPDLIHVSANDSEQAAWLTTAARLAAAESTSKQRGAAVVVDRLAEALLMQTLRLFFDRSPENRGFLAAVRDRAVGQALRCLHGDVAHEWSLAKLARESGLSRSALAERFRTYVGESPMKYLARWRMLESRELLRDGSLSVAEVAHQVGYQSEFAFSKAFKRFFGRGPGAVRRSA